MKRKNYFAVLGSCLIIFLLTIQQASIAQSNKFNLDNATNSLPHIKGQAGNADYLYTTAGNRLYCIGSQKGAFPEVGFHVPGEMGGIWQQPIKLMDGYGFVITDNQTGESDTPICDCFTAYSFATKFHYSASYIGVTQTQFVPDDIPVLIVEYKIQNLSGLRKQFTFELNADINLMPVWLAERLNIKDGADTMLTNDGKSNLLLFKDQLNTWYNGIGFENSKASLKRQ
jgi:hypothetical protein